MGTSSRKPDYKALVTGVLDVYASREMLKNLDLKVSNGESYRADQFYWNCTLCMDFVLLMGLRTLCVLLSNIVF